MPVSVAPAMAMVASRKRRRRLTLHVGIADPLVAGAEDGGDERGLGGIVLDFAAQVGDVDVDGALGACVVPAEDALQEIRAGEDAAGSAAEGFEQLEFGGSEGDGRAVLVDRGAFEIDRDCAEAQGGARGRRGAGRRARGPRVRGG